MDIPRIVRAMVRAMPDAVVRPENAEQVSLVVGYCQERGLPAIPRGGGCSGLFGTVPKKGGVAPEMLVLNSIGTVDVQKQTVTAGAGTTWWQRDSMLSRQGLTLRSYPSSAR